jgi:hypothetical protein
MPRTAPAPGIDPRSDWLEPGAAVIDPDVANPDCSIVGACA